MFIHSNDRDALLKELYQSIGQIRLALRARDLGLSEDELEDCLMDVWQTMLQRFDTIPHNPTVYLWRIAHLQAIKCLKRKRRESGPVSLLGELIHDLRRLPKAMREEVLELAIAIRQIEQMKADMPDDSPGLKRFKNLDPYRFANASEEVKAYVKPLAVLSESDFRAVMQQSLTDSDEVRPVIFVQPPDKAAIAKLEEKKREEENKGDYT